MQPPLYLLDQTFDVPAGPVLPEGLWLCRMTVTRVAFDEDTWQGTVHVLIAHPTPDVRSCMDVPLDTWFRWLSNRVVTPVATFGSK